MGGHKIHLLHGGNGKVHGGLLIIPKAKAVMHQVLNERGDLLRAIFRKLLRKRLAKIQIHHVTDGSFTTDVGLLQPTGCVKTTPQMTRIRDVVVCNNLVTEEIDDHRLRNAW